MAEASPQITDFSWGEVNTSDGSFKDVKLWPGGACGWDWNDTGTKHTPGIQPADVADLVAGGAEIVVLSTGQEERLQVKEETIQYLSESGVEVIVLETNKAVEKYNKLAAVGQPVGALIHSTC